MADSCNPNARQEYYCHNCKCRIPSITESFSCINCGSGFVEEVEAAQQPDNSNEIFNQIFSTGREIGNDNFLNLLNEMNPFNPNESVNANLERFLSSLLNGAQTNGPFIRFLHGNPEDYVWSTDGLDSVITQLLNQIDNAGPPPMPESEINKLNEISITDDHVNNKIQCPICMEDFLLDEKVKELKCHHFFHNDCIVEWLKLHSTCPTCRMEFQSDKQQQQQQQQNATTSNASSQSTTTTNSRPDATTASTTATTNQSSSGYNFNDDDLD